MPAEPLSPAERAYRDGRLMGALLKVAQMARAHLEARCHAGTTALTCALYELDEAERAAGVNLTTPTDEDLRHGR